MQITIHTKGLHLSEEETSYIHMKMEKITTLAKRLKDESSKIEVEVDHDDTKAKEDEITCSITVFVPKSTLRAESHGALVTEAVDLAKKKLIPQIDKYKDKFG